MPLSHIGIALIDILLTESALLPPAAGRMIKASVRQRAGGCLRLSKKATGRKSNINLRKNYKSPIHSSYLSKILLAPAGPTLLLSASCASYRIHIRLQRRTPCPCSLSDSLRACQKQSFLTRSRGDGGKTVASVLLRRFEI